MLRRTKCNTLDAAGYTYNPYTTMDTFGSPSGLMLTALEQHELPIGADNSAIPVLGHPSVRNGAPTTGSDASAAWKSDLSGKQKMQTMLDANTTLLAFVAIVVLALIGKLPGSR
jgi:hypothetical protein